MIVLDTNVISELMNPKGAQTVKSWVDSQPRETLFTTTVTQAEILYGVAILPEGRRKQKLQNAAYATFSQDFLNRILLFDIEAAEHFASIAADRKGRGHPISQFDAQIAAICQTHQATLATRNVDDFIDCGIEIINPWAL